MIEEDVTAVAVTYGPGLVGALLLLVCQLLAAFAWAHGLSLIPVNHMATSWQLKVSNLLEFPLLFLLVSGGHTELVYVSEAGDYKIVMKL